MAASAPPPPSAAPPAPTASTPPSLIPKITKLDLSNGLVAGADRILIYGAQGIGKSTLAAYLPGPLFFDLQLGTRRLNVTRDTTARDLMTLRGKLAMVEASPPPGVKSIVIDTATDLEDFCKAHVIASRKTDSGTMVRSIEDYGWGKGWQFVFEEFSAVIADLDRLVAKGFNVCLIAHAVSSNFPNPGGADFIRWEPHLYAGDKNHRGSIRDRVIGWSDHVLFIGYDVAVVDGKGLGSGTRTIYGFELPTHVAKSRRPNFSVNYAIDRADAVWRTLEIVQ